MPLAEPPMTADEVAAYLRTSAWSVVKLCREGKLRAAKPGRAWLITHADFEAYLEEHSNQKADVA